MSSIKTEVLKSTAARIKEITLKERSVIANGIRNKPDPIFMRAAELTVRWDFLSSIILLPPFNFPLKHI